MEKTLFIIIPDNLNILLKKGEFVEGYYNPCQLFENVHLVTLSNTKINQKLIEKMKFTVGKSKLHIYALSYFEYILTLFPFKFTLKLALRKLLKKILSQGAANPSLIRCYGYHNSGYFGVLLKKQLKIPLIVSIHNTPEFEKRNRLKLSKSIIKQFFRKITLYFQKCIEDSVIKHADQIIAVYHPACISLEKQGARNISVIYNAVNKNIQKKKDFKLHNPIKLISVGNQISGVKDPTNFILALKKINATLDLIGNGNLHHQLQELAKKEKVEHKIRFIKSLPNNEIVKILHEYDIYLFHTFAPELSKSIIEAMLAKLPIIHNIRETGYENEFPDDLVLLVPDSVNGYYEGINQLINNIQYRQELAEKAYRFASENYNPFLMEKKIVNLYEKLLNK